MEQQPDYVVPLKMESFSTPEMMKNSCYEGKMSDKGKLDEFLEVLIKHMDDGKIINLSQMSMFVMNTVHVFLSQRGYNFITSTYETPSQK